MYTLSTLNSNIRCIEIMPANSTVALFDKLNSNIRCIEMIISQAKAMMNNVE